MITPHKVAVIIDVASKTKSANIRELSDQIDFPPATIQCVASTLLERHFFKLGSATKKYSISLKFLELASRK